LAAKARSFQADKKAGTIIARPALDSAPVKPYD